MPCMWINPPVLPQPRTQDIEKRLEALVLKVQYAEDLEVGGETFVQLDLLDDDVLTVLLCFCTLVG
jgi:hypothetical protein